MYEALPMDLVECFRQTNGDALKSCQIEWSPLILLKYSIQWLAAFPKGLPHIIT